jgi:acetoin utilization protein AcuB
MSDSADPMRVRDAMTPDPIVIWPSTSVLYARRVMHREQIRHLPVVAGSRLVGMVSARDIQLGDRVLAASLGTLQSDLVEGRYRTVQAVMSQPVIVVAANAPLRDAAAMLVDRRIGAPPVVDGGRLVGIMTTTDCLRVMTEAEVAASTRAAVRD